MLTRSAINKRIYTIFLQVLLILLINGSHAFASSNSAASSGIFGHYWHYSYGLGPYRTFCSAYINLQRGAKPEKIQPKGEIEIFKKMLRKVYAPKYILIQFTVYPLAALSSFLETDEPDVYKKFELYNNFNMLKALGGDYEEPYAVSLFLGNIVGFQYERKNGNQVNKAERKLRVNSILSGLLFSGGHLHIQDNIRIPDKWLEILLMFTGKWDTPKISTSTWDFRLGFRFHKNPLVTDVAVIILKRDHTEWKYNGWSLLKNSVIQTTLYMPFGSEAVNRPFFTRQLFLFGKKYPVRMFGRSIMLKLNFGMLWEQTRLYNRWESEFDDIEHRATTWLIQPGIEF